MPRSAISHARTRCGSAPAVAARVVIAVGFVDGLDDPPSVDAGQRGARQPAQLGQPGADVLRARRKVFTERHRKTNARSKIGLTVLQALPSP